MIKTVYVQVEQDTNKITDLVEVAEPAVSMGYIPIEIDTPIPQKIFGKCYELIGDSPVYRKEWDRSIEMQRITDLENAIAELAFGGEIQ